MTFAHSRPEQRSRRGVVGEVVVSDAPDHWYPGKTENAGRLWGAGRWLWL